MPNGLYPMDPHHTSGASRIRLQCGGGARSQWLLVVGGVGYQLQLPTAVRSSRRGRVNVVLFVFVFGCTIRSNTNRLFVSLFGTEANTKRIFGTALVQIVKYNSRNSSSLMIFNHCNYEQISFIGDIPCISSDTGPKRFSVAEMTV